jgi:hypothetical protein
MRALVYHGPGQRAWKEVNDPEITDAPGRLRPARRRPVRHSPFGLDDFEQAYDVFSDAASNGALKVVLTREEEADE